MAMDFRQQNIPDEPEGGSGQMSIGEAPVQSNVGSSQGGFSPDDPSGADKLAYKAPDEDIDLDADLTYSTRGAVNAATAYAFFFGLKQTDSALLLLGMMNVHPRDVNMKQAAASNVAEPIELLDYFGVPDEALFAELQRLYVERPDVDRLKGGDLADLELSVALVYPETPPPMSDECVNLLRRARDIARRAGSDQGLVRIRDLFGAMLTDNASTAYELLSRTLYLYVDLDRLGRTYDSYLRADPSDRVSFGTFLPQLLGRGADARADLPAGLEADELNFAPYANALALVAAATQPPLAVGVYGPWGSGKSSVMRMVQERLKDGFRADPPRSKTWLERLKDAPFFRLPPLVAAPFLLAMSISAIAMLASVAISSLESLGALDLSDGLADTVLGYAVAVFVLCLAGSWLWSNVASRIRLMVNTWRKSRSFASAPRPRQPEREQLITIWFNAWANKDSSTLWSNLVTQIYEEMEKEFRTWPQRIAFFWKYRVKRWRTRAINFVPLLAAAAGFVLIPGLGLALFPGLRGAEDGEKVAVGGLGALITGLPTLLGVAWKSASGWYKDLANKEANGKQQGLADIVRNDIRDLYQAITGQDVKSLQDAQATIRAELPRLRIVVFIDDLDRCPPDRAVEILEAIKLVLESGFIIVFIAMDTRMLVRAIETSYRDGLPATTHPGGPGMEYLEKIIQIPFWVPQAQETRVKGYATSVLQPAKASLPSAAAVAPAGAKRTWWEKIRDLLPFGRKPYAPVTTTETPEEAQAAMDRAERLGAVRLTNPPRVQPTEDEVKLISDHAGYFSTSPRGIKRVVNLFRLAKSLYYTGLIDKFDNQQDPPRVIRMIVLAERFPDFLDYVYERVFFPAKDEAVPVADLVGEFIDKQRPALETLPNYLRSARTAELHLLADLVGEPPTLTADDMQRLAPCIVNLPPVRAWNANAVSGREVSRNIARRLAEAEAARAAAEAASAVANAAKANGNAARRPKSSPKAPETATTP